MKVEREGLFVGPDGGEVLTNPVGGRMLVKLREGDTGGSYSVHENVIPAGSPGPLPHIHHDHEETFYVLEGELTVRVGERRFTAPVGSFVVIPRGVVHQPSNPGADPTRVLLIFSPSGMERFFEEAAEQRIPLQMEATDPDVLARRDTFTRHLVPFFGAAPVLFPTPRIPLWDQQVYAVGRATEDHHTFVL